MAPIVFPASHSPGLKSSEGAGRLVNCFAEKLGDGARSPYVLHRVPGLKTWGTTSRSGFRGGIEVQGVLYAAFDGKLEKFSSSGGASTNVGNLNGSKRGFFARNYAVTPDLVFVDTDGNIATFTVSSVTNSYPDSDLPAVNSVDCIKGYFAWSTGDGKIYCSDLNSTAVNALSYADTRDELYRVVAYADRLYGLGKRKITIWSDQGLAPFPLGLVDTIPRGVAGAYCVTGHEPGFSKGLFIVADDNGVYKIVGNDTQKISPSDLDDLIEAVADKTELEMTSYTSRGHALIEVSSPTWTWVYNINTGEWHTRKAYLGSRSRIASAVYGFGKWLAGDTENGNLPEITRSAALDVSAPLVCEAWSAPVQHFPNRIRVASMWFNFTVGVGDAEGEDPIATDPTVEISWSDDGGQTFSTPRQVKLGRQAVGNTRVRVNQCGMTGSQGRIVKVAFSDPVHFGLTGGEMVAELRAA